MALLTFRGSCPLGSATDSSLCNRRGANTGGPRLVQFLGFGKIRTMRNSY